MNMDMDMDMPPIRLDSKRHQHILEYSIFIVRASTSKNIAPGLLHTSNPQIAYKQSDIIFAIIFLKLF